MYVCVCVWRYDIVKVFSVRRVLGVDVFALASCFFAALWQFSASFFKFLDTNICFFVGSLRYMTFRRYTQTLIPNSIPHEEVKFIYFIWSSVRLPANMYTFWGDSDSSKLHIWLATSTNEG